MGLASRSTFVGVGISFLNMLSIRWEMIHASAFGKIFSVVSLLCKRFFRNCFVLLETKML